MLELKNPEIVAKTIAEWIKDYFDTNSLKIGIIGLSGGIDSALVATLATKALGADRVKAVLMPYTLEWRPEDVEDAELVANHLGLEWETFEIKNFADPFEVLGLNEVERGNVIARCRMITLYALANKYGGAVLGTGNKSELMIGYFTKYGDGGSDLLPIGDLYKTEVFQLAKYLGVHEKIIRRKPTAGLWKGQTDEDEIGMSYEVLDGILYNLIELKKTKEDIIKMGYAQNKVEKVIHLIKISEHKRRTPPIPKIH